MRGRADREAQSHDAASAARLGARTDRCWPSHCGAGARGLPRLSVRAGARRIRRTGAHAMAAEMPRGGGLCGDEHHAAVGVGMVGQCHGHFAGDTRFLSLALGADRLAGGGLCRATLFPVGARRPAREKAQYGCSHFAGHPARARHVGGGNCAAWRRSLFRFRRHASAVLACRSHARPGDASAHARGSRKSRRAQGRDRAARVRGWRFGGYSGRGAAGGRPHSRAPGRSRPRRWICDLRRIRNRREPDHRRDPAPARQHWHAHLCGGHEFRRRADGRSDGCRRGHVA